MVNKKKVSIMGGSFLLVAAVVACVVVLAVNKSDNENAPTSSSGKKPLVSATKSVQAICQPTDYRKACEEALMKEAGDTSDLKALVRAAFKVPVEHIKAAVNRSAVISAASKDPETTVPLETCRTLFDYAVHDLEEAVTNILGYEMTELDKAVYDVKNWISAAGTYQYSCLEEFRNKNSEAALAMKKALNTSLQLTSNALSIADQIGSMIMGFDISSLLSGRKLLTEEGHPTWLTEERRELLQLAPWELKPLVVVAQDGSGNFSTINEGLKAMPTNNKDYVVMYVKEGVYKEQVQVERKLNKLVLIGDGPTKTRITGNLNVAMGNGIGTFKTATFGVAGDEFIAKDIGFENTAGPEGHQAVALRSNADYSVFYNCQFDGYQDTLYAHAKRQYYRDCIISGTVDFIFGDSSTVFQNCKIVVRKPMANQQNIVTAHGGKQRQETTAFVLHNCTFVPEPALVPFVAQNPSYLGRPWKPFARTIVMQSEIDGFIHPDGWLPWVTEPDSINTCYYAEIDNRGPGADKSKRVKWPGVQELTMADAQRYTVESFFNEAEWPKKTGVPHITGLLPQSEVQNVTGLLPQSEVQNATGLLPQNEVQNATGLLPQSEVQNVTGLLPQNEVQNVTGLLPQSEVRNITGLMPHSEVRNVTGLLPQSEVQNITGLLPQNEVQNVTGLLPQSEVQNITSDVQNVTGLLPQNEVQNVTGLLPQSEVQNITSDVQNVTGLLPQSEVQNITGEVQNVTGLLPQSEVQNVSGLLPQSEVQNITSEVQNITGLLPQSEVQNVTGLLPQSEVHNITSEVQNVTGLLPQSEVQNVTGLLPQSEVQNVTSEVQNITGLLPQSEVQNVTSEVQNSEVQNITGLLPQSEVQNITSEVQNITGLLPQSEVHNVIGLLPQSEVHNVIGLLPQSEVQNVTGLQQPNATRKGKGKGKGRRKRNQVIN